MLNLPDPIHDPETSELVELCLTYMEHEVEGKEESAENIKHFIFEEAMVMMFGKGIFDVIANMKAGIAEDHDENH